MVEFGSLLQFTFNNKRSTSQKGLYVVNWSAFELQHAWMARTISDIVADKNSTFTLKQKQMGKSHIFKLGGNFSCPMSGMLHCLIANLDWILQRHSICAIIQIDNQKMQHYMARGSNRQ
ncbi:uncharacterized protein LOC126789085 isoform X1 [Argentina anserina]|uniref:uncharacterized protein LOC126789085 isoform X1 n=1 Tax=Argentina anserina TaxID=57926 RepID=UPI0021767E5C|nr:uncharacterized protein LOC126789085 isoform X1 [Potentilla anserina]